MIHDEENSQLTMTPDVEAQKVNVADEELPSEYYSVRVRDFTLAAPAPPLSLFKRFWKKKVSGASDDLDDRLVLRDVNASVGPGEILAVIGGSGSGKSTFLHAIVSRLGKLVVVNGQIDITSSENVKLSNRGDLKKVVGFVPQNDFLLPHLTGETHYILPSRSKLM